MQREVDIDESSVEDELARFVEMEMVAFKGRSQTMQGVWLAWAEGADPCTLVMDLEGTDGRERGRMIHHSRSRACCLRWRCRTLLLINMWCHDIR